MTGYPTPDELLAAHRTMSKMVSASMRESMEPNDWPNPESFRRTQWGDWVEAKRQIAIACNWLIDEEGDAYHLAWERMISGDDDA